MWPFSAFTKYRAKRQYARKLSPALHKMYGHQKYYKPEQIRAAAKRENLDIDYICWGYSMHLTAEDFSAVHRSLGEVCDYEAMRGEIVNIVESLDATGWFSFDGDFDIGDFGGD